MSDPETYEITVIVTGRNGETRGESRATVTVEADGYCASKVSEIGREAEFAAMSAALLIVPRSVKDFTPLDIIRHDGDVAGGSRQSSRTPLPSGGSAPLAEDIER